MATQIESHRTGAEVVKGDAICSKKTIELLEEIGLPKGLLPLEDIQEFGYNRATGFMWLVQGKKKVEHTFKKIKQTVSYASEVTAFAEKGKLRKITGVKTKELMLWLSVVEVYIADATPEKVTFKTGTGLSDKDCNPMASQIESHRASSEVLKGDAICSKKCVELLEEIGLPKGLLPLEDIQEFGYNRATGFMWLVQGKKKVEHTFKKIKQTVSYAAEVTAFVEKGKLRKITGVKTKELMLWLSVVEVYIADATPEKVTFKTGTGLSDSFDATAFALGE
ncbi:hypothetical protein EJB05_14022, partial [Eragrostis curvula]